MRLLCRQSAFAANGERTTKRKANKAKLAIDVRLTRRMSDASATFMACACHGLVLSPSLSAAQCVMCRRKCLHLDMKELRECGSVCVGVRGCVRVCVESWPSKNVTDIYGHMRDWNKAREKRREGSAEHSEVALIVACSFS